MFFWLFSVFFLVLERDMELGEIEDSWQWKKLQKEPSQGGDVWSVD